MDCWHCGTELIWGGDHDLEEEFYGEDHAYDFVTNLSCPKCQAYVEVHHRKEGKAVSYTHLTLPTILLV